MSTLRHEERGTRFRGTRWLIWAAVLIAIAVAVVLLVVYAGGDGGGVPGY